MVQLLCLGDHLLSLYSTGALRVWRIGSYDAPEVHLWMPSDVDHLC